MKKIILTLMAVAIFAQTSISQETNTTPFGMLLGMNLSNK
jgi:hypothetical protein